jgi:energy-coupling factor transporter ATP-binding protein EcfA2
MRLTSVHADNVLTFEDFHLDLNTDELSVLVGPNGSGKTNVFRVVRLVWDAFRYYELNDSSVTVRERLEAWTRDTSRDTTLEVGIEFNESEEQDLIARFVRAWVADSAEFLNGLGSPHATAQWWDRQPQRRRWVELVGAAVSRAGLAPLLKGRVGLHVAAGPNMDDATVFFAPEPSAGWMWQSNSPAGITPLGPRERLNSWTNGPLTRLWVDSWPEGVKNEWREYLTAGNDGQPPQIPLLALDELLTRVISAASTAPSPVVIGAAIQQAQSQAGLDASLYHTVGLDPRGGQVLTFGRIVTHLLGSRLVISEDLLSPPAESYPPVEWWMKAHSFKSRHLGAYLLALKLGPDGDRLRYESIQQLFGRLCDRHLDVVVTPPGSQDSSQQILMVQRSPSRPSSVPLTLSGSGLVELAYVCTLMRMPGSHVVLMDEPGRALHPQALIRLQRELCANRDQQIVLITHSPYLVPADQPESVVRLAPDAGGSTCIHRLVSPVRSVGRAARIAAKDRLRRQDQWGRSPNWRALLFSTVALIVDGETELGALPEWYRKWYAEEMEACGASIIALGGKGDNYYAMSDLDAFGIPWVNLVDGDSLRPGNNNIWGQLRKAKGFSAKKANRLRQSGWDQQIEALRTYDVFVSGVTANDNFETAFVEPAAQQRSLPAPPGLDSKVLRGRWVAQNTPCPKDLEPIFERLRALALQGVN